MGNDLLIGGLRLLHLGGGLGFDGVEFPLDAFADGRVLKKVSYLPICLCDLGLARRIESILLLRRHRRDRFGGVLGLIVRLRLLLLRLCGLGCGSSREG